MNLQMIDHIEKILSPSPEYDLQLLRQAGFISEAGLPNLTIINLEVARISVPFANQLQSCSLRLSELRQHFKALYDNSCYREIHTLCLYLMEAIDFSIPSFYMQLPASPAVLRAYLHELIDDFIHISTDS